MTTTYTYLQKLGVHETDQDKIEEWAKKGKPHFKKNGKYWVTQSGIPVVWPDSWKDLGTIKVAPLPRGIEAVEQTTDKRVVV